MKTVYRFEPGQSSVYKVQEDSSYTKVVFDGTQKGIISRIDRESEEIGYLLCCSCDPEREILEVSGDFYQTYYNQVMKGMDKA